MGFRQGLTGPATDALGPIIAATTRAAGITAAAATGLAQPLFPELFTLRKSRGYATALGVPPRRGCPHCGGFAPAAPPRRAWTRVSVSISGLPLSWPVPIFGLVGRYPPTNYLIGRRPILGRADAPPFGLRTFQYLRPMGGD